MKTSTFYLCRPTVIASDEPIALPFVPPLQRRRLSLLQQRTFAMAHRITHDLEQDFRVIFASQDGEDDLTRKLVEAFNAEGDVSPMRFSTSVYNAAPGLYSILTKNVASYSAIAAGNETLECSLLEVLSANQRTLWIYSEETNQTPTFGVLIDPVTPCVEDAIPCTCSPGVPDAEAVTPNQVQAFLLGERTTLVSRYFTLTRN